ncbi:MAG: response regulator transcription factor [Gemmatimonadetes bacterium]|uniref:Response regulator transcription factor n=1 Tax=Candidatus Kutchimonas denitrificans TaxID=3056748 RepID=A0AAE5C7K3_9BACT|nr:response regulator transcription factor [Gemmatimonadota bacterium]NIR73516.1 response regulator transcription factor [Candidatus Kutchimonas denitrificans]NIR99475.1 response regulator transcription factor [Gemmatimonadota bacterium]NIT65095.1 response regulator transcription factor [Gemmatimonadota bacterium]NIV23628.1 response regulator [Gemmatimonadota bacterium]
MTIRTLIVDDEELARRGLRDHAARVDDLVIVGECANGREALAALERDDDVDLVLLDVQMPGLDGFQVLRELEAEGRSLPLVIFVTAFDEFALKAFEVHAVDYLLKPVSPARFAAAIERARKRLRAESSDDIARRLSSLLSDLERRDEAVDRLLVKTRGRSYFVNVNDIDWIEADGNYAILHTGAERHLIRETMRNLERQLGPKGFARIHRSTIVNLDRIEEIQPWFKGDHLVILRDGRQLSLTRKYRPHLEKRLGGKL